MRTIEQINKFVNENKNNVNNKYRLKFHMMPPIGWMNDPNGLIFIDNEYHLFYQYNPYNSLPGTMLWGHFVSKDLIKYKDLEIALAPNKEHESIYSGGTINVDNNINALFTLHYENAEKKEENIYKAVSKNKVNFDDYKCVFDNESLPENICRSDFRDPCPVKIQDNYYVFIGGKDKYLNKGLIIVLRGKNLDKLEYFFTIGPFYELGDMGECPSYCHIDGKDVLVASGCHVPCVNNDFKNENSSVFIVGSIDFENGKMDVDFIKEIDKGDTFYAPQFINGADVPIMIGWLEMWGKPYPTHEFNHGWSGALSIPRTISIIDNDIFQNPVSTINGYHQSISQEYNDCLDLSVNIKQNGKITISGIDGNIVIGLDKYIYLDTINANNMNGCIRRTNNSYNSCRLRIILDVSSVEIFVENGKEAISSRIYLGGNYKLSFDNVDIIDIKEIGVE